MKIKNYLKITAMTLMSVFAFIVGPGSVFGAVFSDLSAYGVDTVSGYSTILSTSRTYPSQDVTFTVIKPDGTSLSINAKTDLGGVAKADLSDFHTRLAGVYKLSASIPSLNLSSKQNYFSVYSGEISPDQSSLSVTDSVAKADGKSPAVAEVYLRDAYDNPLEGHEITLISSRASDLITKTTGKFTDKNGFCRFEIKSLEAGPSVFSAVDTTTGIVLSTRAQVAFMDGFINYSGGDGFIPVALAAGAGPINQFIIADLPAQVNANQNVSFSVTAADQQGLTVENYTGTIHFSVDGSNSENVSLPEDYSFKAEDLGTHIFSLGLKFTLAGSYKIIVTDINNQLIKGQTDVTVGSGSSSSSGSSGQGKQKPVISSPVSGTYSQNVITISGTSTGGPTVKIYDNDQEISSLQAGTNGAFSFQTGDLADGAHSIYAVTLDSGMNSVATSDKVNFTIDTTPPPLDEITLKPSSGIKPGDVVNVTVLSEENLSQAALIFNNDIIPLTAALDVIGGKYLGSFKAPSDPGVYPVDVLLVDQLGNETTYANKASVTITNDGGTISVDSSTQQETQQTEQVIDRTNQAPGTVYGVIAYGGDKKVTLVWEAATDDSQVKNYKIYYGTDSMNLNNFAETADASTTWYIPGLDNGKEFYFAVSAVDDSGLESIARSETVSGIPFSLETINNVPDRPTGALGSNQTGDNLLKGAALEGYMPPENAKDGPELLWLIVASGSLAAISEKLRKKISGRS